MRPRLPILISLLFLVIISNYTPNAKAQDLADLDRTTYNYTVQVPAGVWTETSPSPSLEKQYTGGYKWNYTVQQTGYHRVTLNQLFILDKFGSDDWDILLITDVHYVTKGETITIWILPINLNVESTTYEQDGVTYTTKTYPHTASESYIQVTVYQEKDTRPRYPSFNGYIRNSRDEPIIGALLALTNQEQVIDTATLNEYGQFQFTTETIQDETYQIQLVLVEENLAFQIYDAQGAKDIPATIHFPAITVKNEEDLNLALTVTSPADDTKTIDREDHQAELALFYTNTYKALKYYQEELEVQFQKTLNVITYADNHGTAHFHDEGPYEIDSTKEYPCNVYDVAESGLDTPDAPMNREWHEFSHYVMWIMYEELPELHYDYDSINNKWTPLDENHKGNSNHCTSDSWIEGFAEFMPILINKHYASPVFTTFTFTPNDPTLGFYPVGNTICSLETNYVPAEDEEFAVASILYDLWDGKDAKDNDNIQISADDLWEVITGSYFFPVYYQYDEATDKTIFDGITSESRPINYVTDLYQAIKANQITGVTNADIDQIFGNHGYYKDTDNSGDYTTGDTIQVQDTTLPERRNFKVPDESTLLVEPSSTDSANLVVNVEYAEPYQSYGYQYTIPITGTKNIGVTMPPAKYTANMTFTLTADDTQAPEEYTLGTTQYWTSLGTNPTLGTITFTTQKTGTTGINYTHIIAGIAVGIIIALIIIKRRKPEPETPSINHCPTCGQPATWVPQYKRWYCYNCQKYLE